MKLRQCVETHVQVVYPKIVLEIFSALPVRLAAIEGRFSVEPHGRKQRLPVLFRAKMV